MVHAIMDKTVHLTIVIDILHKESKPQMAKAKDHPIFYWQNIQSVCGHGTSVILTGDPFTNTTSSHLTKRPGARLVLLGDGRSYAKVAR